MTLNEITTLIAGNLGKELDIPFRLQLAERVLYWRARLIVNNVQKTQDRSPFTQTLYLSMKKGRNVPCRVLVNCPVAVTEQEVPQIIEVGEVKYDYLGAYDGRSMFVKTSAGTGVYMDESIFSARFTKFEDINDRILVNNPDVKYIRIDAIFYDPRIVKQMNCNCDCSAVSEEDCDVWDSEFPLSPRLIQLVVQSILQVDYNRVPATSTPEIEVK